MRKFVITIMMMLSLIMPAISVQGIAFAAAGDCPSGSRGQELQGIGESGTGGCDSSGVNTIVADVVNLLSIFVGILAIVMIILAGAKYITSGGDANKVGNAKNTLLYAAIGIVVAVLAQAMVHFVLYRANIAASPCKSNPSISSDSSACK